MKNSLNLRKQQNMPAYIIAKETTLSPGKQVSGAMTYSIHIEVGYNVHRIIYSDFLYLWSTATPLNIATQ